MNLYILLMILLICLMNELCFIFMLLNEFIMIVLGGCLVGIRMIFDYYLIRYLHCFLFLVLDV